MHIENLRRLLARVEAVHRGDPRFECEFNAYTGRKTEAPGDIDLAERASARGACAAWYMAELAPNTERDVIARHAGAPPGVQWEALRERFTGIRRGSPAWAWLFAAAWHNIDRTREGFCTRLKHLIEHGAPPKGWHAGSVGEPD